MKLGLALTFLLLAAGCASIRPDIEVTSTKPVTAAVTPDGCSPSPSGLHATGTLTVTNHLHRAVTPSPIVYRATTTVGTRTSTAESYRQVTNFTVIGFLANGALVRSCLPAPQNLTAEASLQVPYAFPIPGVNPVLAGQVVSVVSFVESAKDGNYRELAHTALPSGEPTLFEAPGGAASSSAPGSSSSTSGSTGNATSSA